MTLCARRIHARLKTQTPADRTILITNRIIVNLRISIHRLSLDESVADDEELEEENLETSGRQNMTVRAILKRFITIVEIQLAEDLTTLHAQSEGMVDGIKRTLNQHLIYNHQRDYD